MSEEQQQPKEGNNFFFNFILMPITILAGTIAGSMIPDEQKSKMFSGIKDFFSKLFGKEEKENPAAQSENVSTPPVAQNVSATQQQTEEPTATPAVDVAQQTNNLEVAKKQVDEHVISIDVQKADETGGRLSLSNEKKNKAIVRN